VILEMDAQLELTNNFPCYLCGEWKYRVLHEKAPFKAVKCPSCGLVYITPRLLSSSIMELYGPTYWKSDRAKDYGYTDYLTDAPLYLNTYRMRSRVIDAYKREPGRVLDVGCAAGFFLKVMDEKGWETQGIEISDDVAEYARKELGLEGVLTGDTSLLAVMPRNYFDVISFWDVVEHLEDPRAALRAAHSLLKDDGILIVETQNVESAFAHLLGKNWQHYKHEEHLYHFSPRTIRMLLDQAGYHVVENTPRFGGKKVSLDFIIERVGKIHPLLAGRLNIYLNFFDEMIVVSKKAGCG
jgi:SAM-dependent methyltransferase